MTIEARKIQLLMQLRRAGISDTEVLGAMEKVPRDLFVPLPFRDKAYDDSALPIGFGQTITQPSMIAAMLQALKVGARHTVLEIGTGSGYQAALLAMQARRVYSVDAHRELQRAAEAAFSELTLSNIVMKAGDGSKGWAEQAPFDRIIVSGAVTTVPPALFEQLASDGIMVIPVITNANEQSVMRYTRTETVSEPEALFPARFARLAVGDFP
jgi:protein-L-isoaspartate(D-aspartate) O-methyltransferase